MVFYYVVLVIAHVKTVQVYLLYVLLVRLDNIYLVNNVFLVALQVIIKQLQDKIYNVYHAILHVKLVLIMLIIVAAV
jgi:hypothetical protein